MGESILLSIKKLIGFERDYTAFDTDLITHINTYLALLRQVGVGPEEGFLITGYSETWSDFLGEDETKLNMVKTFVYTRVKPVFDPPSNSFVASALKDEAAELIWRINVAAEEPKEDSSDGA